MSGRIARNALEVMGHTPMVRLNRLMEGIPATVKIILRSPISLAAASKIASAWQWFWMQNSAG